MKASSRLAAPRARTSAAGASVASTRPACMSEIAVAALALVHEVRRDEDRHAAAAARGR